MAGPDLPPLALLLKAPAYLLKRARRALVRWRLARRFRRRPDHPALDRREALARARDADAVLFLCWGNVCRSPFAERLFRSRLADRGVDDVSVRSAGTGRATGRSSPPNAVRVARRHGVDLRDHASARLDGAAVRDSDAIFVMAYNDYHDLAAAHPGATDRTFFLGPVAGAGPAIDDPYSSGVERFEAVYATIAAAVDELAAARRDGSDSRTTR